MVLSLQAGQQITVAEAQRTEMLQMLQSFQASNKKQADMLQRQKAAIRQSPEVVQIQQLEDAIQQTQEVVWRCVRTCLGTVALMLHECIGTQWCHSVNIITACDPWTAVTEY